VQIKTKLKLGLGFLFSVIILLSSLAIFYIYTISKQSKDILKDNYESIQYATSMIRAIDEIENDSIYFYKHFESNLNSKKKCN